MNVLSKIKYLVRVESWTGIGGRAAIGFESGEREVVAQFAIRRDAWTWGFQCLYYDGPHMAFGIGPLLLISWDPWTSLGYRFAMWIDDSR